MDFEYFEQIMSDGAVGVDCTECDYSARIEPDADCPCPETNARREYLDAVTNGEEDFA
jgi:hypothetical protein